MKLQGVVAGFGVMLATAAFAAPVSDTVVLLHGLGRTRWSMMRIASALKADGYRVVNATYPSRRLPVEQLAAEWLPAQLEAARPEGRVHFVTHSMGGILVRAWLREHGMPANLGRVVMLAPPNAGSELPDRLATFPPFRWCTGVNGHRLGTSADALPVQLGAWPADAASLGELGVIAGCVSLNPLFSVILPGPDDGKVTVATTHLRGQRDHLVLPFSHTWLGWRAETIAQIKAFLREGAFQPSTARRGGT